MREEIESILSRLSCCCGGGSGGGGSAGAGTGGAPGIAFKKAALAKRSMLELLLLRRAKRVAKGDALVGMGLCDEQSEPLEGLAGYAAR